MKRDISIFLIMAAALLGTSCSGSKSSDNTPYPGLEKRGELFYKVGASDPFTGTRKYAADEEAAFEESRYTFQDGELRKSIAVYPGGQLYSEANFDIDGHMQNLAYFYESGQIKSEFAGGLMKEWYENGQLKSETHFSGRSVLDGKVNSWYPDGTLRGSENYVKDNLDGSRLLFDPDGQLILKQQYEQGRLVQSDTLQPAKLP